MAFGSTELAIKSNAVSAAAVAFTGLARIVESGDATSVAASDPRSAPSSWDGHYEGLPFSAPAAAAVSPGPKSLRMAVSSVNRAQYSRH